MDFPGFGIILARFVSVRGAAFEIRISDLQDEGLSRIDSKHESRNSKQIQMFKIQICKTKTDQIEF